MLLLLLLGSQAATAQVDTNHHHLMGGEGQVEEETVYDPDLQQYIVIRRAGGAELSRQYLSEKEYRTRQSAREIMDYWKKKEKEKSGGKESNSLIPKINLANIPAGLGKIDIRANGSAELIMGIRVNSNQNPSIPLAQRTITTFQFDQNIQVNVTGSIGDKIKLGTNFNTEAVFAFENQLDLKYEGGEDDILQLLEFGNVNMGLTGQLIQGSSSLFGVKNKLKFGRWEITSVFSQQQGQRQNITVQGGAQITEFDLPASKYEANRHYFLGDYFKNNYDQANQTLPYITSPVNITRIEVWVTNRINATENIRNIVAILPLGETLPNPSAYPSNGVNNFDPAGLAPQVRDITSQYLFNQLNNGTQIEKLTNARLLGPNEYTFNPLLGYISLNQSLNADEVLAVSFEFTAGSQTYKVGEFSQDLSSPSALVVKLLKSSNLDINEANWPWMMKNIYSIGGYNIGQQDFTLNILYQDTETGVKVNYFPNAPGVSGTPLLQLFNLDRLNPQGDQQKDGFFDFLEGKTIVAQNGRIIFPVSEPFSARYLSQIFTKANQSNPGLDIQAMTERYAFDQLYENIQELAELNQEKNRFYLGGSYKGASGSEISLNAFNVPQGSVTVTAGGQTLLENTHYTVDYAIGRVRIIDDGILSSGLPINISMENNATFNIQQKRLMGTHVDYKLSKNLVAGATIMNLSELPLTQKIDIGNEPVNNTIWGVDLNFTRELPFITRLVDKIPGIDTKAPSLLTFNGEFAHLIPGFNGVIDANGENGVSYIDDFEAAETAIEIKSPIQWKLGSVPQTNPAFPNGDFFDDLRYGFNRAKLTWFTLDPLFFRQNTQTPANVSNDPLMRANNYLREVRPMEVFPGFQPNYTQQQINQQIFDVQFYPAERGPYNFDINNFDENISDRVGLKSPKSNFGLLMRRMETTNWDAANIAYIEFWMMDPYQANDLNQLKEWDVGIPGATNKNLLPGGGGDLLLQVGNLNEDFLRDGRMSYENGLPTPEENRPTIETAWGKVPLLQPINQNFDNLPANRDLQDVGYDGLNDPEESGFFQAFMNDVELKFAGNPAALQDLRDDPSGDNFRHYAGASYDNSTNIPGENYIHNRYKHFLGPDGNSPAENNTEAYGVLPNSEDINVNYTLDQPESYYQYRISMRQNDLDDIGENFITDILETTVSVPGPSGGTINKPVKWIQFRIPIYSEQRERFGNISDFRSIRFMRMALKEFDDDVFLRMATMQLVRSDWRVYQGLIADVADIWQEGADFNSTTVNIEENTQKTPFPYVLPPGITREIDPANPQLQQLNEQSLVLNACDLKDGEGKGVFKNTELDLRAYRYVRMNTHLESRDNTPLDSNDVSIFVRLGMDASENYYEYEIPLKPSDVSIQPNAASGDPNTDFAYRQNVWPAENLVSIELKLLSDLKLKRNSEGENSNLIYSDVVNGARISVRGNPNLANIRTMLVGVRNPSKKNNPWQTGQPQPDDGMAKCVQVWVNELRATDYFESGGWAALARTTLDLADFGQVGLSVGTTRFGFGSIEQRPQERSRENTTNIDLTTKFELGKFFGKEAGVSIPVFFGYSGSFASPQFNPLDPDIIFTDALGALSNDFARDSLTRLVEEVTNRKSFNINNMRKQRGKGAGKPKIYDVSNLSASYSFTEELFRDTKTEFNNTFQHKASITYGFSPTVNYWEPFKRSKKLKSPWLKIIKDFNLSFMPKRIGFSANILRDWNEFKLRNTTRYDLLIETTYRKNFTWTRNYEFQYNPTRALTLTFSATNNSRIDEPEMPLDSVIRPRTSFLGRNTRYTHRFDANYSLPINKLPWFDWVNVTAGYGGDFSWTASNLEQTPQSGQFTLGRWGNVLQNNQSLKLNSQFNMNSLYRKSNYLKKLHAAAPPKKTNDDDEVIEDSSKVKIKIVSWKTPKPLSFKKDRKRTLKHQLKTEDVDVVVLALNGDTVKGKVEIVDDRRIRFISASDVKSASVTITGKRIRKKMNWGVVPNTIVRLITGFKNISVSYTQTNGTVLPGYAAGTDLLGLNLGGASIGPDFAFGRQYNDQDLQSKIVQDAWLVRDSTLNQMFMRTHSTSLSGNATYEPFRGFRITFNAERTFSENYQTNYRFVPSDNDFRSQNPLTMGNFSMSYMTLGSFFDGLGPNFSSPTFDRMLQQRSVISKRLAEQNPNNVVNPNAPFQQGFGGNQTDVLYYSFISAYTGTNPESQELNMFPQIPIPNWRLQFDGLKNIPFFADRFKNIVISHSYKSTLGLSGFQSNNVYNNLNSAYWNATPFGYNEFGVDGNYVSRFFLNSVSIQEQFQPLIKIDMTFKNEVQTAVEVKSSRNISLNFPNNQLTETNSFEVSVGAGYKVAKFKLPFLINGKRLENGFNVRADIGWRDNSTIIRKIQEEVQQITAGQQQLTIKVFAEYELSKAITARAFIDHMGTNPFVSNQFPNSTTNGGISIRFTLQP